MLMKVKYLQSKDGMLRFRRRVPKHLVEIIGRGPFWTAALGLTVDQQAKAPQRVEIENRNFELAMKRAEHELRHGADPHQQALDAEAWARENKFIGYDQSGLLADPKDESEYHLWLETKLLETEKRLRNSRPVELTDLAPRDRIKIETVRAGGRVEQPVTLQQALEVHAEYRQGGEAKKAEKYARTRFEKWLKASGANARYTAEGYLLLSEFSRADAKRFVQDMWKVNDLSYETIKRTITVFKAFWNTANEHFEIENPKNPWSGLKPPKGCPQTSDKEKRLPFNALHWKGIERGLRANSVDPEVKLVIRTLACTGARPLEIGGLMADEVHDDPEGVWIDIRVNDIRGTKTIGSPRRLPIVDRAVAAELVALAEKRKGRPLFQRGFHTTSNLSQRLNGFLRKKCGIPASSRTVAYSFRHSMRQALRVAEVPDYLANYIYAHVGNKIADSYGAGSIEMFRLEEALNKAIPRLGEVDLRDYTEEEKTLTIDMGVQP